MKEKETKRFRLKRVIVIIFLLALLLTSGTVFAYWAAGVLGDNKDSNGTVQIGEGDNVDTVLTIDTPAAGGLFVPVGREDNLSTFSEVGLTYTVEWVGDETTAADGHEGLLNATVVSVLINGADFNHLFTITLDEDVNIVVGGTAAFNVNVEFTHEPADIDEYNLVANNELVITLNFEVVPTP